MGIGLSWVALHDFGGDSPVRATTVSGTAATGKATWGTGGAVAMAVNWPAELTARIDTSAALWPSVVIELPDYPDSNLHSVMRLWIKLAPNQEISSPPAPLRFELQADGTYLGQSQILDGELVLRAWDGVSDGCDNAVESSFDETETTLVNCNPKGSSWSLNWADGAGSAEPDQAGLLSVAVGSSGSAGKSPSRRRRSAGRGVFTTLLGKVLSAPLS